MTYFNIIKLDATDSTNDWLKHKYNYGKCNDGDLIWADHQIKGRGQRDKIWESVPGKNLTFSLYKHYSSFSVDHSFLINCAVSLAVVTAISQLTNKVFKLKWPNDILSGEKKIGGVLIENMVKGSLITGSIIGIGINVNQVAFEGLPQASSLALVTGENFDIKLLFDEILKQLNDRLNQLAQVQMHKSNLLQQYEGCLFRKGEPSQFSTLTKKFDATLQGITENGEIVIKKSSGAVLKFAHGAIKMIY
ncbi:MAG: biotin--[acetyl-CoA-carboxylase] ligase [Flavobacteriaceae bacterium]|nr:biotin--[acetyl-CoA-carboxylase] ligase [Flavobacteriaceae bacterium]